MGWGRKPAARSTKDPMNYTRTVRLTGTCPSGHKVRHDTTITTRSGQPGQATADADCPTCGDWVQLTDQW